MRSPTGVLISFCVGVAATLGWQSYGDAAREMIASSYPQLGWLVDGWQTLSQKPSAQIVDVAA
jgi:hypothetical protein